MSLGKTRTCPHCKATVLESASVCPGCRHHLRFDAAAAQREPASYTAWKLDGSIGPRDPGEACEYSVIVSVHSNDGTEIARQVVAVGALQPAEMRRFSVAVEMTPARAAAPAPRRPSASSVVVKQPFVSSLPAAIPAARPGPAVTPSLGTGVGANSSATSPRITPGPGSAPRVPFPPKRG